MQIKIPFINLVYKLTNKENAKLQNSIFSDAVAFNIFHLLKCFITIKLVKVVSVIHVLEIQIFSFRRQNIPVDHMLPFQHHNKKKNSQNQHTYRQTVCFFFFSRSALQNL